MIHAIHLHSFRASFINSLKYIPADSGFFCWMQVRRNVRENTRNCLRHQLWLLRVLKNNCASKLSVVFAPAHHFTGEMLFADIFACCEIAIHPANSSRPFLQTFRVSWSFESANIFSQELYPLLQFGTKHRRPMSIIGTLLYSQRTSRISSAITVKLTTCWFSNRAHMLLCLFTSVQV